MQLCRQMNSVESILMNYAPDLEAQPKNRSIDMLAPLLHLESGLLEGSKVDHSCSPFLVLSPQYISSLCGSGTLDSKTKIQFTWTVQRKIFFVPHARDFE
jgi:hypothetical protein